ncbi:glycosyltransferase family 2 protein [Nitrosopumilus piranensis]|uniref:Glycosyl transferase family 2 n=1 Tax=Nitrosopumilus piranensis TaxID=1582439 RepID=A0A0C5BNI3_9ARCH|nr:glycosyltransferase family 2 protein [Nitrosopumilus piranensis]AJM91268.1 Glycosyl transferase family 2 [Nitrosopumilus piranensis]
MLSIGLPVYNGEKSIEKSINSLLNQTFTDFELIISDNASNDNTEKICREYAKKDSRIKYYRQDKNIGPLKNFSYVLENATSQYFMWAADDDLWEDSFIEKNIQVLESDPNTVGSISKVDFFGNSTNRYAKDPIFLPVIPARGNYEQRFSTYLKLAESTAIYSIFRTDCLKQSVYFHHLPWDLSIILAILKFGELNVIDEILFHRSALGESSSARSYEIFKNLYKIDRLELLFMFVPFLKWCIELFGIKFIFKNFNSILKLHVSGYGRIINDELQYVLSKFTKE